MRFLIFAECDALDYGRSFKLQNQILWKREQWVWILKPRLQNTLREKHNSLQILSLQSQRMKVKMKHPHYSIFSFVLEWRKVLKKYYFKISLSKKKIWLNYLCLAILFRAYIHSSKLDTNLPPFPLQLNAFFSFSAKLFLSCLHFLANHLLQSQSLLPHKSYFLSVLLPSLLPVCNIFA